MLGSYYGLIPKEATLVGPLPLGTRIHNALEAYYTTGVHPVDAYNKLQRIDNNLFMETMDAHDEEKVDKFNKEAELGRVMMEGYLDWVEDGGKDSDFDVLYAEESVSVHLKDFDPRVHLIGKIDMAIKDRYDGLIKLMDHKSAAPSNAGNYLKYSAFSEQLMHYCMLHNLQEDTDYIIEGGVYNVLKKSKRTARATGPFYERTNVRFNKKTLASYWTRTLGIVQDMMNVREKLDAGEDHLFWAYPTQKMDWTCGTCPFFKGCSLMDDGSNAEEYFMDNFVQGDPNARYKDENDTEK